MSKLGACMVIGGMFIIGHGIGIKDKEGKLPGVALHKMESFVRGLKIEDYFKKAEVKYPSSPLRMVTAGFDFGMLSRLVGTGSPKPVSPIGWNGNGEDLGGYYRPYYRNGHNGHHNGYHNGYRNGYRNGNGYHNGNGYRDRYPPYYDPSAKYRYLNPRNFIDVDDDDDDGEFNLDLRIRAR